MPEINLGSIAEIVRGKLVGNPEALIRNLETDSRKVHGCNNGLFIAIRGTRHDGHNYIRALLNKGIRNFLLERIPDSIPIGQDVNYILVQDSMQALHLLAKHYRQTLTMPVVAITGSNGKTVVKEWLAQCLSRVGGVSRSPKSYNSQLGVPLSVWMIDPQSDWSIIEAGISQPGEMQKLQEIIQPTCGIFTTLGPAHQENFSSMEEKCQEKLELFKDAEFLYYCSDHAIIHSQIQQSQHSFSCICWSVKDTSADLYVRNLLEQGARSLVQVVFQEQVLNFDLPFTDKASVENCLQILLFLLHNGVSNIHIQEGLRKLTPVAMRLEQLAGIQNCTLINDSYNSDIHSLRIALDYLSVQQQHKQCTIILSDIMQSGQDDAILHKHVADLLRQYTIGQLALVGERITQSPEMPGDALRFDTTLQLLQNIGRLDIRNRVVLVKGARAFGFEKIISSLSEKKHITLLEINLNKLVNNLNYFRSLLKGDTRIMVMVKALSYGSGGYEIANLLQHQKVDYLGVAFTDEGIALREAGITLPIMVMSPAADSCHEIIEYNLEPEIYSLEGLQRFNQAAQHNQIKEYPVHLKLDTGMHRLGFMPDEIEMLIANLQELSHLRIKAVFSHLAVSSDPQADTFTRQQLAQFDSMYKKLSATLGYAPMRHILNSAGIERFPEAHFDMVRLGIGLHGISSVGASLEAVSTLKTRIVQIKKIPKTETVGYNRHGVLNRNSVIAVIPVGYADGLNRHLGNRKGSVLIHGKRCEYVGDICMDMSMIDVTDIAASVNDEVIIFGPGNSIERLAEQLGTIPYEVLTSVSGRVKRVYLNE